jgi:DNA-nicking Smr family endonuclease
LEDTLDLHGVSHEDASEMVHRFINDHWVEGWTLHVITGNSTKMKSIVQSVLNLYQVDWIDDEWNAGSIKIFT